MKTLKFRSLKAARNGLLAGMLLCGNYSYGQLPSPTCRFQPCGSELTTNGDFESGNMGFSSSYTYRNNPLLCEEYTITDDASSVHPLWTQNQDHTGGGLFFAAESNCNLLDILPTDAWSQSVDVVAGEIYIFSVWVSNLEGGLLSDFNLFNLTVGGVPLLSEFYALPDPDINVILSNSPPQWVKICAEYVAPFSGSVDIAIQVKSALSAAGLPVLGGSFGLDDISFRAAKTRWAWFGYQKTIDCVNQPVLFTSYAPTYDHEWTFEGGNPSSSTDPTPVVFYPNPGRFRITHKIRNPRTGCEDTRIRYIRINTCDDGSISCEPPSAAICGVNMINNGDFENGNTGFDSDYNYAANPSSCASYTITTNASNLSSDWHLKDDHTYGNDGVSDGQGKFFAGNGHCDINARKVWSQDINVNLGEAYLFSAWFANLSDNISGNNPAFYLSVDGIPLSAYPFVIGPPSGTSEIIRWIPICGIYSGTKTGKVEVAIHEISSLSYDPKATTAGIEGGDFGIDDITFQGTNPGISAFIPVYGTPCSQEISFLPLEMRASWRHSWDFGDGSQKSNKTDPTHTYPNISDTYTVEHTVENIYTGCSSTTEFPVIIIQCEIETGCNVDADFKVTSYSLSGPFPETVNIEFAEISNSGPNTTVTNHQWSSNGYKMVNQGSTARFQYVYNRARKENLAIVNLCTEAETQIGEDYLIEPCADCECKVYNISSDGRPNLLRSCTEEDLEDIINGISIGGLRKSEQLDHENMLMVQITPNPSQGEVTINLKNITKGDLSIELYDINGQLVEQIMYGNNELEHFMLKWNSSTNLSTGIYFLRVTNNNSVQNHKLFIN